MNEEEHEGQADFGPPPDVDAIAELLLERYPVRAGEKVKVIASSDPLLAYTLVFSSGRDHYRFDLAYLRGAQDRDPWLLTADALDALFGGFLENDRAYRDIPQGDGIEFDGAFFRLSVERTVPDLSRQADRLLTDN